MIYLFLAQGKHHQSAYIIDYNEKETLCTLFVGVHTEIISIIALIETSQYSNYYSSCRSGSGRHLQH